MRLVLLIGLAVLASAASDDSKMWWSEDGERMMHPNGKDYVRVYVKTAGNARNSRLRAVGLEFTLGMLKKASKLPKSLSIPIPTANGSVFTYEGYEHLMPIPRRGKNNPYTYAQINWGHNGHPTAPGAVPLTGPDNLGPYAVPHWDMHFYYVPMDYMMEEYGLPPTNGPPSGAGACTGLSPGVFLKGNKPIPTRCFPKKKGYANVGDAVFFMGNHLEDLQGSEWVNSSGQSSISIFNQSVVWGQYDGKIIYLEVMANNAWMKSRTWRKSCFPVRATAPLYFAKETLVPDRFCAWKSKENKVYIQLESHRPVPQDSKGCTGGPYAAASYLPAALKSILPPECTFPTMP